MDNLFNEAEEQFEWAFKEFCCFKDHIISPDCGKCDDSATPAWEVVEMYFDTNNVADQEEVCICTTQEIAISEAIYLLYENEPWSETINIFSNSVYKSAFSVGKVEKLEEMRRRLGNSLMCMSCYESEDVPHRVLVRQVHIINKKREF